MDDGNREITYRMAWEVWCEGCGRRFDRLWIGKEDDFCFHAVYPNSTIPGRCGPVVREEL